MPNALLNSFPEYRLLGLLLAVLVIICAAVLWTSGRRHESDPRFRSYLIGLLAIALATLVISDAIYSVAGYGLASADPGRSSLVQLSFAIAFFAVICTAFIPGARIAKAALLAASAAMVLSSRARATRRRRVTAKRLRRS